MKKRMFCLNMSDKDNVVQDESFLVTERVNPMLLHELEQLIEELQTLDKQAKIPRLLLFTKYIFLFAWIMPIAGIVIDYSEGMTFYQIYQASPMSYFIAPISFLIFTGVHFYEKRIRKNVENSEQFKEIESKIRESEEDSFKQLGIPENAITMDVLGYRYKVKDDQIKLIKIGGMFEYWNLAKRVYIKESELFLASLDLIVSIPLNSIRSITVMNKHVTLPSWNKETPYNKEEYKKYKIKKNTMGILVCRPYYIVNIEIESTEYELYLPNYEIDPFMSLVGEKRIEDK